MLWDMAVVRDQFLIWNPLPEAGTQPGIVPWSWIIHTAVDAPGATSLHGYFHNHTNLESHTWLRFGGQHEQFVPFNRSADANYKANRWYMDGEWRGAISTETEDDGDPEHKPWDAAQKRELVRFGVWLNRTYGIPPVLPPGPFDRGMGFHAQFPRVWSNVAGKTPLALDSIIPTENGPVRLADVQVGDRVFAQDGTPCTVLDTIDVTPQRAYRITFDDGAEVVASDSHLWAAVSMGALRKRLQGRKMVKGIRTSSPSKKRVDPAWPGWREPVDTAFLAEQGRRKWGIPIAESVQPDIAADLPVDPYLLGLWLGDGGSRDGVMHAGFEDAGEIHWAFEVAGYSTGELRNRRSSTGGVRTWRPLGFERELRLLGVLGNKHVPTSYLAGSEGQRLALLAGLLDSDGCITQPSNQVEFTNTNENLSRAVLYLASSLGQRPRIVKRRAMLNGVDHGPAYRVTWRATRQLFRLTRKADRYVRDGGSLRSQVRTIDSVEEVPVVPMRCLQVDSPHSLFLCTEHFIPTHNCPGSLRINQWITEILPAIRSIVNAPTQEDSLVFTVSEAAAYVRDAYAQIAKRPASKNEVDLWSHAIAADPREMWKMQARLVGEFLEAKT